VIVRRRLGYGFRDDWDDAYQEIVFLLFRKLRQWNGTGKFCHWLKVVAYRQAITILIRLKKRDDVVSRLDDFDPEGNPDVDPAVRECFEVETATFPDHWQVVIRRRSQRVENLEIANELGVSERTIKKWVAIMYSRLVECLRP
jgi:DNA-directed RNA polymerase specialized sigma24 family protein